MKVVIVAPYFSTLRGWCRGLYDQHCQAAQGHGMGSRHNNYWKGEHKRTGEYRRHASLPTPHAIQDIEHAHRPRLETETAQDFSD